MARTKQTARGGRRLIWRSQDYICGCYFVLNYQRQYLPQVQLSSHTTINPVCFTTQLTQTFHNPNEKTLENVRYAFPLYDGVAVNGFTIKVGDKVLSGIVKHKQAAKETFDAAVARGETAGLLDALPSGIFGVTLGNVPANMDVVAEVTYCGELKHDAGVDGLRYMLPTSIAPRYGQYPGEVLKSNSLPQGGIKITVDVDMAASNIRRIQSPTHPIAVDMGQLSSSTSSSSGESPPFRPSQAAASLTLGTAELAEDFVLQILIDNISEPQAILEVHPTIPNQRAIMMTMVPKFELAPANPEIIFIADQSGSMSGASNTALVAALKVFLKSLPFGVRFNICAFGSSYKFLWPQSQAYNEGNVAAALDFVSGFTASYGGTELLQPIKAAFKAHLADLPLEIMLLTDGEIWGEEEVFTFINEQIRDKKVDARIFTLGIGSGVSHTLVEGVARAGNGFAQFVADAEGTDVKVMRMLKSALYGHTEDYQLEVHYKSKERPSESTKADDDEFEIVEKVQDCLHIEDIAGSPAATPPSDGQSSAPKQPKSFFDRSIDKVKELSEKLKPTDRYAHLPAIALPKVLQAPADIPPLFPYSRTTAYLLLSPDSTQQEVHSVTLRATSAEGPLELTIPVQQITSSSGGPPQLGAGAATIHQLAARKAIQDLEEKRGWLDHASVGHAGKTQPVTKRHASRIDELREREAVRLGEQFQVASKWTSFVAVEQHDNGKSGAEDKSTTETTDSFFESAGVASARLSTGGMAPRKQLASNAARRSGGSPLFARSAMPPASGGLFGSLSSAAPQVASASFGSFSSTAAPSPPGGYGGALFGAPAPSPCAVPPPPPQAMARYPPSFGSSRGGGFGAADERRARTESFKKRKSSAPGAPSSVLFSGAASPAGFQVEAEEEEEDCQDDEMNFCLDESYSSAAAMQQATPQGAPPAPVAQGPLSLHEVIDAQTFVGSWKWDETFLLRLTGVAAAADLEKFKTELSGKDGDANVSATALVLAWLEATQKEKRDVWEMVATKAKAWLSGQAVSVDEVVGKAKAAASF